MLLHFGIFIVWIPLVFSASRTMPKEAAGNFDHLLAELPKWMRSAVIALFIYALLNFAYFIYAAQQHPRHGVPFDVELRGFSGHWMVFYGWATAGFIGLASLARRSRKSENGATELP